MHDCSGLEAYGVGLMIHVSVLSERVSGRRLKAKAGRCRDTDVRLDGACVHLLIRRKDGGLETLGLGRRGK